MVDINDEKKKIIDVKGNVLVIANPGTGKTLLLAHKYISLLKDGLKPEEILCLTFTNKAKKEMEKRILKLVKQEKIDFDLSKINVYTFHSYAVEHLEGSEIISSNLLRYTIYDYLKQNEILSYGDKYLLDTIVPKMENLIRYLKSFGITPDKVDVEQVQKAIPPDERFGIEDIERFTREFINIFKTYEQAKDTGDCDYADLLIDFLKLKSIPKFKYVLVDELQDVNDMEAEIALKSGENFIAVGDPKQAIFGFQGGSILNFKKFENSTKKVLSENFRSTNEILNYARKYFVDKTEEESYRTALEGFKNKEMGSGLKPKVYSVADGNVVSIACTLAKQISDKGKQVAIIARTNTQIMDISKELSDRGVKHNSTYFAASREAKDNIINFLKSIFSDDVGLIKTAMFTPFFPIDLRDAFELAGIHELKLEQIYTKSTEFKNLRESVENLEDVNLLFKEKIVPVAVTYGEEYMLAALTLQQACQQALTLLKDKSLDEVLAYLKSSDLLANESDVEKGVVLTTVHKAKGKEFENVIYVPKKPSDKSNFQDKTVEGILSVEGVNVGEELEEETLRINFVAFTRAEKNLMIVTDKPADYLNDFSEEAEVKVDDVERSGFSEGKKRAYNLFVNGEYEKAKELLEKKEPWVINFIKNYFNNLDRISFSKLTMDAYEYLDKSILDMWESSSAMTLGSNVHDIAEAVVKGEDYEVSKGVEGYVDNVKKLIKEIELRFPEKVCAEKNVKVPVSKLVETEDGLLFKGLIDAVFKNGERYLIVDWKTNWNESSASKHRQQLEVYKKLFSVSENIPIENIWVAIGYVGLRKMVHDGKIKHKLDSTPPARSAFGTAMKRVELLLSWRGDVDKFFQDLKKSREDNPLKRAILEQYEMEKADKNKNEK